MPQLNKIKEVLVSKRFLSFYWSLGAMIFAFIANNIVDFGLSTNSTIVLGLFFAQCSKALNNYIKENNM